MQVVKMYYKIILRAIWGIYASRKAYISGISPPVSENRTPHEQIVKSCQNMLQIFDNFKIGFSAQKSKVGGYQNLLPNF